MLQLVSKCPQLYPDGPASPRAYRCVCGCVECYGQSYLTASTWPCQSSLYGYFSSAQTELFFPVFVSVCFELRLFLQQCNSRNCPISNVQNVQSRQYSCRHVYLCILQAVSNPLQAFLNVLAYKTFSQANLGRARLTVNYVSITRIYRFSEHIFWSELSNFIELS